MPLIPRPLHTVLSLSQTLFSTSRKGLANFCRVFRSQLNMRFTRKLYLTHISKSGMLLRYPKCLWPKVGPKGAGDGTKLGIIWIYGPGQMRTPGLVRQKQTKPTTMHALIGKYWYCFLACIQLRYLGQWN